MLCFCAFFITGQRMSESGGSGFFNELKRRNVFRVAIAFLIVAWLLLQVVDILVPILTLPDWVGRFFFLLLVIGFPIALLFAWAFELTPEGVKLEKNVDRSESITPKTGRKLDFTIIGVLVVALGVSMYANFDEEVESDNVSTTTAIELDDESAGVSIMTGKASIAVLPFANRSADESDEFFVDGMHDDLLTQLAKISALKVISRTSVLQYRDTEKSMKVIGDELGVTTLLEGGVQRAGDRIRINVQLIDADTDEHIWAETYNRELTVDNIFEIQEEISKEIAGALHAALSPDEEKRIADRPTQNLMAYEAYLVGRQRLATRNMAAVAESVEYFEAAIAEDDNFAEAYAALVEARMVQNNSGVLSREDMLDYARPLVARIESIGREFGMGYTVTAALAEYEGDLKRAEALYQKAIEVGPSETTPRVWFGLLHQNFTGDFEAALHMYDVARELDPVSTLAKYNYSAHLANLGGRDESLDVLQKALEDAPNNSTARMFYGEVLVYSFGRFADGLRELQRAAVVDDPALSYVGFVFTDLGDFDSARLWHEAYAREYPDAGFAKSIEIRLFHAEGRLRDAAELAERMLGFSRDTIFEPELLRAIRDYKISEDDYADAFYWYQEIFPELLQDDPDVHRANIMAAVDLTLLLKMAGREDELLVIAEKSQDLIDSMPRMALYGIGLLDVELYAILGDRDSAIKSLKEANEAGLTKYMDLSLYHPNLASIAGDAEFQRIIGLIQDRVQSELSKVREMENAGRLAKSPEDLPNIVFDLGS
jgi:TolB-like protein/Tfp pilus assembly protein PilF